MSDPLATTNPRRAWHDGRAAGRAEVAVVLLDLIAELVGDDGDGHELTGDDKHGCQVCAAIDRAEARLKEVTDTSGASPRSGPEE